jgi:hypothetical protein
VTADPVFVVGVLGMATIGQTLEEVSISVRTTNILGWSCSGTVDTSGNAWGRLEDETLLELHQVTPVIAEVVDVDEVDVFASAEVEQLHVAFVVDARVALKLGCDEIGIAERQAADLKLVQVLVPPAKCGLDDLMQLTQVEGARHGQAPPDRWLDLLESDPHLNRRRELEHECAVCRPTARWL